MAATLQELLDRQAKLNHQIAELQSDARNEALAAIKALMVQHGLTAADLSGNASKSKSARVSKTAGTKLAAKFRDPETGATWTGRGLKPRWLASAIANGKKVEDFAV